MKERLNLAFPSLLLIAVAVFQMVRAGTLQQSAWKGGGFGMFSTSDAPSARFLRCWVRTPEGEVRVETPPDFQELARLARTVPTRENLERLGRSLETGVWIEMPADPLPGPGNGTAAPHASEVYLMWLPPGTRVPEGFLERPVLGTRIEAWKWRVGREDMSISIEKLADAATGGR
ncbi:MAG: hypothetical protein HUU15_10170 [Candidatus Brocadiae bacterium]|nr:hypothetical protein [Candidatus Brocadiia bacterium]